MNQYFAITIDVEPDCTPSWRYSDPLTFDGVTEGIGKRLQPLFNKYDACPTYLINNVVLEDRRSADFFRGLAGNFELGTHLHPEFIEPQKAFTDYAGKKGEANQCDLPPAIELEKMINITRLFEKNFDRRPTSFRAGRFSAGPNTIRCLESLGYRIDTSVTPNVKWGDKTRLHPVDYTAAPDQPYFISDKSFPDQAEAGKILEVPVSIIKGGNFLRRKPVWLRPHLSSFKNFLRIIEHQYKKHRTSDIVVYNMMFHQVEVMPALSPYSQSEADCQKYLGVIDSFLAHCAKHGIKSIGLSELYNVFRQKR